MTGRIEKISLEWFLTEPALFMVMCSHNIVANTDMNCQGVKLASMITQGAALG
ncbi:hypothetical protein [Prevotella sp.]|nr:hypothetical protein [Prevotella sp.]